MSGSHLSGPEGLTSAQAEELHQKYGYNEVKATTVPAWKKIAWRYLDWVSIVIIAAAIVSIAIPNEGDRGYTSFVLLILELNLIVWVGYYSDRNAGNAIKELEELSAPSALVKRDGQWRDMPVRELVLGDLVALKGGDIIPADARLEGKGEPLKIDESSLTGESLAVTRRPGDTVLAGAVVAQGELEAVVTAIGKNTFFGKTMTLLGAPEERGHLQQVLNRVSVALALVAFLGVITIFAVLMGRGNSAGYSIVICFVIFVSVVPIGMPVVTTTVLAVGAREMAKEKAIVTRLSALEEMSGMEILASDKTGTLTQNKLSLDKEDIVAWNVTKEDVLLMASLSARWENADAIDTAVTGSLGGDKRVIAHFNVEKLIPFNPVDKRTTAYVTLDGRHIVVTKGAPQIIGDLLADPEAQQAVTTYIDERAKRGLRSLGVAQSTDGGKTWQLVGLISLLDPPREDSAATIKRAQELGVQVKMVTGDQLAIGIETSRRLGLGTNFMDGKELMSKDTRTSDLPNRVNEVDGFAGVYPEHKHRIVEAMQARGRLVGMTGDGVNDAPALKKANVGIAVAGATSAAKGAADIILTEEGLSTIITAITHSRMIFRRLETYIIYRMASSLLILGFFFFAIIIIKFEMPTWALVIISLTNDLSVMATSFDKVHTSDIPELWNMTKCLAVAVALAAVGTGATVLLLCLTSPTIIDWTSGWVDELAPGTSGNTSGETVAIMFLALTCLIQLNIFLTRNPSFWWRFSAKSAPPPSLWLIAPVAFFLTAATFIAAYWPASVQPDGGRGQLEGTQHWGAIGITWAYVLVWWLAADFVKYWVQRLFRRYDIIKEHAKVERQPVPAWVRAVDRPGDWADAVSAKVEDFFNGVAYVISKFCCPKKPVRRRPASKKDVAESMRLRLSQRDVHGNPPPEPEMSDIPLRRSFRSVLPASESVVVEIKE